jgi:hypothetical protein
MKKKKFGPGIEVGYPSGKNFGHEIHTGSGLGMWKKNFFGDILLEWYRGG